MGHLLYYFFLSITFLLSFMLSLSGYKRPRDSYSPTPIDANVCFFQLSKNLLNKLFFFYHRSLFSPCFCFYVAASIECRVPIDSLTPRKVLWCEGWVELIYHWNARNVSHVTFRGWISFQVLFAFYRIPQPPLLTYICKESTFCTLSILSKNIYEWN